MNKKRFITPLTALSTGILLDSAGVAFITKSNLGVTSVSAIPYIFQEILPALSYGTWYYIFQISLMLILLITTGRWKKDYLISFLTGFFFSLVLDAASFLIRPLPVTIPHRILYFLAGTLLLMCGVAFLINSRLPIMPADMFTREYSAFRNIPYRKFKTVFDITCVIITTILSFLFTGTLIGISIGTFIGAFINGIGIAYFKDLQCKYLSFRKIS